MSTHRFCIKYREHRPCEVLICKCADDAFSRFIDATQKIICGYDKPAYVELTKISETNNKAELIISGSSLDADFIFRVVNNCAMNLDLTAEHK